MLSVEGSENTFTIRYSLFNILYSKPKLIFLNQTTIMKPYDLSQPLNQDVYFWPYYPPFEVKYIKRKSEHGVNAQYIQIFPYVVI